MVLCSRDEEVDVGGDGEFWVLFQDDSCIKRSDDC